jgi:hypothetical protein
VDDHGYFVTEMVWDEVTDDEAPTTSSLMKNIKVEPYNNNELTREDSTKENVATNERKKEKVEGNNAKPLSLKSKKESKDNKDAKGNTQKSMMSFFKKT